MFSKYDEVRYDYDWYNCLRDMRAPNGQANIFGFQAFFLDHLFGSIE